MVIKLCDKCTWVFMDPCTLFARVGMRKGKCVQNTKNYLHYITECLT